MECFGGEEDFEFNTVGDGNPVKVLKDRDHVVTGTGEEVGSRVLDVLKLIEEICGCAIQNAITVIMRDVMKA